MHTRIGLPQLTREGGVVPSLHIQHMLHMRSALDSPDDDKETDPTVERLVTELVQQCQEVCDKYGEDVSMALAQDEVDPSVHAPGAQQPLHIKREATKKYAKHWAGLIVMLLRLFRHESGGGTDGAAHHLAFLCENKVYLDHRATLRSLDRHIARRRRLELCSGAERQALVDALGLLSVAIVEEEVRGKAREETGLLLLYSSIRGIHVQETGMGECLVRFKSEREHSQFLSAMIFLGGILAFNRARTDSTSRGDTLNREVLRWRALHPVKTTQRAVPRLLAWRRWTQVVNANSQGATVIDISRRLRRCTTKASTFRSNRYSLDCAPTRSVTRPPFSARCNPISSHDFLRVHTP